MMEDRGSDAWQVLTVRLLLEQLPNQTRLIGLMIPLPLIRIGGPEMMMEMIDEWDELKPDIVSYGSGIMSATYAAGTTGFPGQPRDMADDEYDSKDGTSMSTPLVSGIVALMLQADDSLTPQEIKRYSPEILAKFGKEWTGKHLNQMFQIDGITNGDSDLRTLLVQ